MTMIIEEQEIRIGADDWRSVVGMGIKEDTLASLVEEYLANGGTISTLETGKSSEIIQSQISGFNSVSSKHTDVIMQRRKRRQEKDDNSMIPKVDAMLNNYATMTRADMCKALGISNDRLLRLLDIYFKGDPRVAELEHTYMRIKTAERVARVKEAQALGIEGRDAVARFCRMGTDVLRKLHEAGLVNVPSKR